MSTSAAAANDQSRIDIGGALGRGSGARRSLLCLCLLNICSGWLAVAYRGRSAGRIVLPKRRAGNDDKGQRGCRNCDFHAASDQSRNRKPRLRQPPPKAMVALGLRPVPHHAAEQRKIRFFVSSRRWLRREPDWYPSVVFHVSSNPPLSATSDPIMVGHRGRLYA